MSEQVSHPALVSFTGDRATGIASGGGVDGILAGNESMDDRLSGYPARDDAADTADTRACASFGYSGVGNGRFVASAVGISTVRFQWYPGGLSGVPAIDGDAELPADVVAVESIPIRRSTTRSESSVESPGAVSPGVVIRDSENERTSDVPASGRW